MNWVQAHDSEKKISSKPWDTSDEKERVCSFSEGFKNIYFFLFFFWGSCEVNFQYVMPVPCLIGMASSTLWLAVSRDACGGRDTAAPPITRAARALTHTLTLSTHLSRRTRTLLRIGTRARATRSDSRRIQQRREKWNPSASCSACCSCSAACAWTSWRLAHARSRTRRTPSATPISVRIPRAFYRTHTDL